MKKIISMMIACVLVLMSLPGYATTTNTDSEEYVFENNSNISEVLNGIALGSGKWSADESLSSYASLENQKLTLTSARKTAFISLDNKMLSNRFDMTTNISLAVANNATDAATGFVFAAGNNGYYTVLFKSNKTVEIAKRDKLYTASGGQILKTESVENKLLFDGTSQSVKITLGNKRKISAYSGTTLLAEYETEEDINEGFFGFIITKNITAEYSNFKITRYKDKIVYDESDYAVPEFSVEKDGFAAKVKWTNPGIDDIESIKVLADDGNEVSGYSGDISLKASAENTVTVSNLPHNVNVGLKIKISFKNHSAIESEVKYVTIPYSDEDYKITDFSIDSKPAKAVLKWTNPVAEGIRSIEITDDKGNVYAKNVSLQSGTSNNVTISGLQGGKSYTFSVTVKYAERTDTASRTITAIVLQETGYHPQNVQVFETYTKLGISWLNPTKPLASISIIDCATGTEAKISDKSTVTLTAGGVNNILLEELPSVGNANYRIIFNFTDGHEAVEYVAGGVPYGQGKYNDYEQSTSSKISGWDIFYNIKTASYPAIPADIVIDRDEKVSGKNSLKFVGSYAQAYDSVFYQLRIKPFSDYDPQYTYKISMKVKYTNAKDSVILVYGNKAMNCYADGTNAPTYNVGTNLTPKQSTSSWETISFLMKPTDTSGNPRSTDAEFAVRILNTAEAFWIDDMEMVPVDESGNPIGDNILPNGSFDTDDHTPCGNVKIDNTKSSLKNGTATLYWENPEDTQLKNVLVYREIGGELYECARLSSSSDNMTMKNISTDEDEVTFVIKTVDTSDNVSSGSKISLSHLADDCVFGKIKFVSNGQSLEEITEGFAGKVTASVTVTNNNVDNFSGVLAVVGYQNGILKSISVSPTKQFNKGAGETTASAEIEIKSGNGWKLKAFLLNNITDMKLLTEESEI